MKTATAVGIAVTMDRSCFEPLLRLTSLWLFGIDIITDATGTKNRDRTYDLRDMSPLLYQLSYFGIIRWAVSVHAREPNLAGGLSSKLDSVHTIIGKSSFFRVMVTLPGFEPGLST